MEPFLNLGGKETALKIRVYHSFARSGGTLLNKILGVHPKCLVLSEVSPVFSYKPLVEQAVEWLGLIDSNEKREFSRLGYANQVAFLEDAARTKGKNLVVRDWVTVNFLPNTAEFHGKPSGILEQQVYLRHAGLQPLPIVIARRSAAVYRSIVTNFVQFKDLELEAFSHAYLRYAQAVCDFPVFHLEEISRQPKREIPRIFAALELPETDVDLILSQFSSFEKCTGDNTLANKPSSGEHAQDITAHPSEADEASPNHILQQADRLLGYGN